MYIVTTGSILLCVFIITHLSLTLKNNSRLPLIVKHDPSLISRMYCFHLTHHGRTDRNACRQTDGQECMQTDRRTGMHANRQTDRNACLSMMVIYRCLCVSGLIIPSLVLFPSCLKICA